jgi:hypothetical protein
LVPCHQRHALEEHVGRYQSWPGNSKSKM